MEEFFLDALKFAYQHGEDITVGFALIAIIFLFFAILRWLRRRESYSFNLSMREAEERSVFLDLIKEANTFQRENVKALVDMTGAIKSLSDSLPSRTTELIQEALGKQTETILEGVKALLHHGVELRVGVLVTNKDGMILYANNESGSILGYSINDLLYKSLASFESVLSLDGVTYLDKQEYPALKVIRTKHSVEHQICGVFNPQKSRYVWLVVSASPRLSEEGEIETVVVSFFDAGSFVKAGEFHAHNSTT